MDLNSLLHLHQLSLMAADPTLTPPEQRAHDQFARDFAEQIRGTRKALGAPPSRYRPAED